MQPAWNHCITVLRQSHDRMQHHIHASECIRYAEKPTTRYRYKHLPYAMNNNTNLVYADAARFPQLRYGHFGYQGNFLPRQQSRDINTSRHLESSTSAINILH